MCISLVLTLSKDYKAITGKIHLKYFGSPLKRGIQVIYIYHLVGLQGSSYIATYYSILTSLLLFHLVRTLREPFVPRN